jgi:hypothetical protein
MPWPGFEPGRLAALPPQSGRDALASNAIVPNGRACSWLGKQQAVPACLMRRNGDRIPGANRGPIGGQPRPPPRGLRYLTGSFHNRVFLRQRGVRMRHPPAAVRACSRSTAVVHAGKRSDAQVRAA